MEGSRGEEDGPASFWAGGRALSGATRRASQTNSSRGRRPCAERPSTSSRTGCEARAFWRCHARARPRAQGQTRASAYVHPLPFARVARRACQRAARAVPFWLSESEPPPPLRTRPAPGRRSGVRVPHLLVVGRPAVGERAGVVVLVGRVVLVVGEVEPRVEPCVGSERASDGSIEVREAEG